jgi:hypothetical protein
MTLKSISNAKLGLVLVFNFVLYSILAQGASLVAAIQGAGMRDLKQLIPAGAAALLAGILTAQLSPNAKARIAFFRWSHPLPGSRAFSKLMKSDPRIDVRAIEMQFFPLPTEPNEQNALWYKLYRSIASEPSVLDAHANFLFCRDYAVVMLLLLILIWIGPLAAGTSVSATGWFCLVAAAQMIVAMRAAKTRGERLVCNVLAIKSAEIAP